jgi:hypothetical protein
VVRECELTPLLKYNVVCGAGADNTVKLRTDIIAVWKSCWKLFTPDNTPGVYLAAVRADNGPLPQLELLLPRR